MTDSEISTRLYEALSVLPGGPVLPPVDLGSRAQRQQRRRKALVVGLAAVVSLAVALPFALTSSSTTARRIPLAPIVTSPGLSAAELAQGHWSYLPESPITPRYQPSSVWTGTSLLIWGGENDFSSGTTAYADGAAYTPADRSWSPLPASPLSGRAAATAIWTGSEVLVWGGVDAHNRALDDGAAYNPTSHTWRTLPRGPLPAQSQTTVVFAQGRALFLGGMGKNNAFLGKAAAYDPGTDQWTSLPSVPQRAKERNSFTVAAAMRDDVLVHVPWQFSQAAGPGSFTSDANVNSYRLDPTSGTWTHQPTQDQAPRGGGPLLWTGKDVLSPASPVIFGGLGGPLQLGLHGRRYDPTSRVWSAISHGPVDDLLAQSVWTGKALLSYDTGTTISDDKGIVHDRGEAAVWDPATDRWTSLPAAPLAGATVSVWAGTELLEWGLGHGQFLAFGPRPPLCAASSLQGTVVAVPSFSIGTGGAEVTVTNTSARTCTVPEAIRVFDADRSPAREIRGSESNVDIGPNPFVVEPGGRATMEISSVLESVAGGQCPGFFGSLHLAGLHSVLLELPGIGRLRATSTTPITLACAPHLSRFHD